MMADELLLDSLEKLQTQVMEINAEKANEDRQFINSIRLAAFTACIPQGGGDFDTIAIKAACKKAVLWSETYKLELDRHRNSLT